MSRRHDTHTLDLLSWEPAPIAAGYSDDVAGKGALGNKIARLVSRALRDARDEHDLRREQVAEAMSAYLGRSIAVANLDHWASEANDDRRIPLDAFAALIHATKADALLGFLPGLFGFVAVDSKYEALIQLHEIEKKERQIAAIKAGLETRLRSSR